MDEQAKQRKADIPAGEILQMTNASLLLPLCFTGAERVLILPARVETPGRSVGGPGHSAGDGHQKGDALLRLLFCDRKQGAVCRAVC